jgi:hypothetical protein
MMDVVVADVPANYGMLFYQEHGHEVGRYYVYGYDICHCTSIWRGKQKVVYKDNFFSYVVSDQNNPRNHPIYVVDEDLGCCILSVNEEYNEAPTPCRSF